MAIVLLVLLECSTPLDTSKIAISLTFIHMVLFGPFLLSQKTLSCPSLSQTTSPFSDEGGAIFVQSSSTQTEIQNCYFKNNSAPSGGALYLKEGVTVTVKGSTFEGNSADSEGGAIYSEVVISFLFLSFFLSSLGIVVPVTIL